MVTTNQEPPTKDLLQRVNIRTMKKDIQRLREADALKEREKIGKLKTTKRPIINIFTPPVKRAAIIEKDLKQKESTLSPKKEEIKPLQNQDTPQSSYKEEPPAAPINKPENVLPPPEQSSRDAKVKKYATEEEKQQMFLLESQKSSLENRLRSTVKGVDPSLLLEKNRIVIEQRNLQKQLDDFITQEQKNEQEQKNLDEKILITNIPAQKQNLEKQRQAQEEEGKNIEKKRWSTENQLAALSEKLKKMDAESQQKSEQGQDMTTKIEDTNNALQTIYSAITEREAAQKGKPSQPIMEVSQDDRKDHEQNQHIAPQKDVKEKSYLKEVPEALKEKLVKSTKSEEEQRRKFIADVENWAKEKKDLSAQAEENTNNLNTQKDE